MQGEDGHGVVGIAVEVVMAQRGVVDGQSLNHLLPRGSCPVRHLLQVLELAYTESFVGTEGEDRHRYTCPFPARLGAAETTVVLEDEHRLVDTPYLTVLTPLGVDYRTGLQVVDDIFVLNDVLALHIDGCAPNGEVSIGHRQFLRRVPVT